MKKIFVKFLKCLLLLVALLNIYVFVKNIFDNENPITVDKHLAEQFVQRLQLGDGDRIDWHDYDFIMYEESRAGPGENGSAIHLTDPAEIKENEVGYKRDGFYTVVSDKISPNRSLPDIRLKVCKDRKYLRELPLTSIIVIFYDEPWSLLLRCLHSIFNRTPAQLLLEVILVNDKSSRKDVNEKLEKYSLENFGGKVRYFENSERKGLIVTRMEGSRRAKGEVIVFLDSHMEVNVNWLPPLLEPIALNNKVATVPIIDSFSPFTLEYQSLGQGSRGSFDWTMTYQWISLTKEYQKNPGDNYQLSAMTGGAYAINRNYFFHLGGYDEGMMVWNGENYELSFKLHLCGGNLIQVPCSHVAHTTKHRMRYREQNYNNIDFSARNLKRVAEVWMDEFKEALYKTNPKRYALDPGDLSKALANKKKLNCKPFKYFLEVIAPDLAEQYPPYDLPLFASGAISTEADPSKCITHVQGTELGEPLQLKDCSNNRTHPSGNQNFMLTWHRSIKYSGSSNVICVDASRVNMYGCHFKMGYQLWKYDLQTHQLINPPKSTCITADTKLSTLVMTACNPNDINQKFNWGYVNTTALENWDTVGRKIREFE